MKAFGIKQLPLSMGGARKGEVRMQLAALPWRVRRGRPQVLLITSRTTRRWIVPKGWPMDGRTPAQAAAAEAWEEAGARGRASDICVGIYGYTKGMEDDPDLPVMVALYPFEVTSLSTGWPEAGQRRRKWMTRRKAAARVEEPELAALIESFDPARLA